MTCTTTEIEITNHKWVQKNNDKKWAQYHIIKYANHIVQFKNCFHAPHMKKKRLIILGN